MCDNGGDLQDPIVWWHNAGVKSHHHPHDIKESFQTFCDVADDGLDEESETGHHHINQLKRVIFDHVSNSDMKK